jgi:hypothetical protein
LPGRLFQVRLQNGILAVFLNQEFGVHLLFTLAFSARLSHDVLSSTACLSGAISASKLASNGGSLVLLLSA